MLLERPVMHYKPERDSEKMEGNAFTSVCLKILKGAQSIRGTDCLERRSQVIFCM